MISRRLRLSMVAVVMTVLGPLADSATGDTSAPMGHPVPGGVITLSVGNSDFPKPLVNFGGRPVLVMLREGEWVAVLGLSLETVPGRYIVSISRQEGEVDIQRFVVKPFRYPVHRVVEKTSRRDTPGQKRPPLSVQRSKLRTVIASWSDRLMATLPLQRPVQGLAVGEFGVRWVKGGKVTHPMNHEQFEVTSGGLVESPGQGRVKSLMEIEDGAYAIGIDHGMGLISVLGYLQDVRVSVGDEVAAGAIIGTAPRAQAQPARISWFLSLNQAFINPLLLVGNPHTRR